MYRLELKLVQLFSEVAQRLAIKNWQVDSEGYLVKNFKLVNVEKIEIAEKISNWKIDVKKKLKADKKILGWNTYCSEKFQVGKLLWKILSRKMWKKCKIGEKFQGEKLL